MDGDLRSEMGTWDSVWFQSPSSHSIAVYVPIDGGYKKYIFQGKVVIQNNHLRHGIDKDLFCWESFMDINEDGGCSIKDLTLQGGFNCL